MRRDNHGKDLLWGGRLEETTIGWIPKHAVAGHLNEEMELFIPFRLLGEEILLTPVVSTSSIEGLARDTLLVKQRLTPIVPNQMHFTRKLFWYLNINYINVMNRDKRGNGPLNQCVAQEGP